MTSLPPSLQSTLTLPLPHPLPSSASRYLCTPQWPYCRSEDKRRKESPFFSLDANLGLVTALIMGFQHMLAMTAGLITPPLIIGFSCAPPPYGTDTNCGPQRTCEWYGEDKCVDG